MEEVLKTKMAQLFVFILTLLTIYTVNSTCYLVFGQEKEPASLKRFKKIK